MDLCYVGLTLLFMTIYIPYLKEIVFNIPNVAEAVLQTASSLVN